MALSTQALTGVSSIFLIGGKYGRRNWGQRYIRAGGIRADKVNVFFSSRRKNILKSTFCFKVIIKHRNFIYYRNYIVWQLTLCVNILYTRLF